MENSLTGWDWGSTWGTSSASLAPLTPGSICSASLIVIVPCHFSQQSSSGCISKAVFHKERNISKDLTITICSCWVFFYVKSKKICHSCQISSHKTPLWGPIEVRVSKCSNLHLILMFFAVKKARFHFSPSNHNVPLSMVNKLVTWPNTSSPLICKCE